VGLPAIVHLHGVGFAAVTGYRPGALELIYPLKTPAWVSDEEFEQAFGNPGRALLLSREPLQARRLGISDSPPTNPTGPVLRLEKNVLAVGQIHSPTFEGSLTLHNDGTEPLTIAEVKSSCPCLTAAVDRQTLPSKESATLRVKGDLDRFGRFQYEIALVANQKSTPAVKLAVRGFFEHPVFFERTAETRKSPAFFSMAIRLPDVRSRPRRPTERRATAPSQTREARYGGVSARVIPENARTTNGSSHSSCGAPGGDFPACEGLASSSDAEGCWGPQLLPGPVGAREGAHVQLRACGRFNDRAPSCDSRVVARSLDLNSLHISSGGLDRG
jgi:hypothetical protein